jgi:hypothetical protein
MPNSRNKSLYKTLPIEFEESKYRSEEIEFKANYHFKIPLRNQS